jgi:hypothetical protein
MFTAIDLLICSAANWLRRVQARFGWNRFPRRIRTQQHSTQSLPGGVRCAELQEIVPEADTAAS